ncbi:MAG: tetratricopeptide repeat protein [candidate division NC10 bacterium]|nr:tetratricopeptide repeat protein [candidate division NC10 bacterium]
MAHTVNSEKIMEGKRSTGRIRLAIMLSSTLAVGFLLGYLASAFVPLVRPPQSPASSVSTDSSPRLSPSEIESALKAAHASLDAGDLQAAWEKYHQILLTDRSQVEALTHLGIILMASNRPDEAIKLYDRALSLNPQYAHALFDKGQALKKKGDAKEATEAFQRFLTLVPPDSDDAKRVKGWIAEFGRSGRPAQNNGDGPGKK